MPTRITPVLLLVLLGAASPASAQTYPAPVEGDFIAKSFKFQSGETLPEVKLHYRTVGTPRKDASGVVRNAVLILHGTGGSGRGFLGQGYAGQLFGKGQLLDAEKYYIILPDNVGHGQSLPNRARAMSGGPGRGGGNGSGGWGARADGHRAVIQFSGGARLGVVIQTGSQRLTQSCDLAIARNSPGLMWVHRLKSWSSVADCE